MIEYTINEFINTYCFFIVPTYSNKSVHTTFTMPSFVPLKSFQLKLLFFLLNYVYTEQRELSVFLYESLLVSLYKYFNDALFVISNRLLV